MKCPSSPNGQKYLPQTDDEKRLFCVKNKNLSPKKAVLLSLEAQNPQRRIIPKTAFSHLQIGRNALFLAKNRKNDSSNDKNEMKNTGIDSGEKMAKKEHYVKKILAAQEELLPDSKNFKFHLAGVKLFFTLR